MSEPEDQPEPPTRPNPFTVGKLYRYHEVPLDAVKVDDPDAPEGAVASAKLPKGFIHMAITPDKVCGFFEVEEVS